MVPLDPGRAAGPAGRPAAVDITGAAPVEPMETTKPVDHATSPTLGSGAWRGRVRVPTVRDHRLQRGGPVAGVDRLRPDKPRRLHRSRPQARAQRVRPASAGVLAPARR